MLPSKFHFTSIAPTPFTPSSRPSFGRRIEGRYWHRRSLDTRQKKALLGMNGEPRTGLLGLLSITGTRRASVPQGDLQRRS